MIGGGVAIAVFSMVLLLRFLRNIASKNRTSSSNGAVVASTSNQITQVLLTATTTTAKYKPPSLQNGQTVIEDINVSGLEFSKHYDLRVVSPEWNNYGGVAIQLFPVANNLVRVVIINETGEVLDLPELTISALKLN